MGERPSQRLLPIDRLDERHIGLTRARAQAYYEAACVCLDRHHASPISVRLDVDRRRSERQLHWMIPDERIMAANANETDATSEGTCAVSLAAVEAEHGLFAIGRAWHGSGSDCFLAQSGSSLDLEHAVRLEVSGVDRGDEARVRSRLRDKILQVENGDLDSPAIAVVVGFRERLIVSESLP